MRDETLRAAWLALLGALFVCAQPVERMAHPYVRATGDATVTAQPDRARLSIGVVTQAARAEDAASQNAAKSEALLAALRHSLGAGANIRTSGYALSPNVTYPREGGQPVVKSYTASNTVEITTDDLANVGKVIDVGTAAGANNVRGLEFLLKDEGPVRARALAEAARKARASADAIAAALGLKVVRVLSAEEGEPQVIRPMPMMAMAGPAQPTPVEAGNIQVQATVTVTLEVAP
ncbi:MAG TPA: SIMPL domain-containing protein [Bryobacteraceae bacterium]|nr:SIMPL domain-containing protein [Bryobacteraceae bacterium]